VIVHAVQTGTVQVHERQRRGQGPGLMRFVRTLLDREWTEPLPILSWVIEHPEGLIVVDTGETARTADPGYFPRWHPYFRLAVRTEVREEEEIGPRLEALGLSPRDVRWVVMTHLHTDHAGGLHHFPDAEIVVSVREYAAARGIPGQLRGYLPHRWPDWFRPTIVDFGTRPGGDLGSIGIDLTRAGDVRIVPTPGHTAGHLSVLVDEGPRTLFLAGDTSYTESALVEGVVDGVSSMGAGEGKAAETLEAIRALARERSVVYLPAHDPESARRLRDRVEIGSPHDVPTVSARSAARTWDRSRAGAGARADNA
jgi:N-acyl homoserine lactone hydrolase